MNVVAKEGCERMTIRIEGWYCKRVTDDAAEEKELESTRSP